MKTLTQIILPIAAVAGLVFGITFVANYSARGPEKKSDAKAAGNSEPPLRFVTLVGRHDPAVPQFRAVKLAYEVGEHGHFDFWFTNARDQDVRVAFTNASCTCAGADLGIVPEHVWSDFMRRVGALGVAALLAPPAAALDAAALPALEPLMDWQTLGTEGKKSEGKVPAAPSPDRPQVGCVRLKWHGKEPPEPKRLTADLATQLPNSTATAVHLEANYLVVPPFFINFGGSPNERSVRMGDLLARSTARREFICWSGTRPHLNISAAPVNTTGFDDCVTVSEIRPLSSEERAALSRSEAEAGRPPLDVLCGYRFTLAVHERREFDKNGKRIVEQMHLGPFAFQLRLAADDTKPIMVPVNGVVRGDIHILGGAQEGDRIDFGESFPRSESRSKQVLLATDVAGLDLDLDRSECVPEYLETTLNLESERDGRKQWRLTVKIPAGKLFDTLTDGRVVLKTKEAQPRRFVIPVKASTY